MIGPFSLRRGRGQRLGTRLSSKVSYQYFFAVITSTCCLLTLYFPLLIADGAQAANEAERKVAARQKADKEAKEERHFREFAEFVRRAAEETANQQGMAVSEYLEPEIPAGGGDEQVSDDSDEEKDNAAGKSKKGGKTSGAGAGAATKEGGDDEDEGKKNAYLEASKQAEEERGETMKSAYEKAVGETSEEEEGGSGSAASAPAPAPLISCFSGDKILPIQESESARLAREDNWQRIIERSEEFRQQYGSASSSTATQETKKPQETSAAVPADSTGFERKAPSDTAAVPKPIASSIDKSSIAAPAPPPVAPGQSLQPLPATPSAAAGIASGDADEDGSSGGESSAAANNPPPPPPSDVDALD
jgi:hypothetical protein